MDVLTYTPFRTSILLRVGLNPTSALYPDVVRELSGLPENVRVLNAARGAGPDYAELENDSYDLRLLVWSGPAGDDNGPELHIHVYPNAVAIAEIRFRDVKVDTAGNLEAWCQEQSRAVLEACYADFLDFLEHVRLSIPDGYLEKVDTGTFGVDERPNIEHTSRTLILSEPERRDPAFARLVTDWLADTIRPEDGAEIVAGNRDYSMTWVNYVIVDTDPRQTYILLSTMRIAQYFWSAQGWFNNQTREIITGSVKEKNVRSAQDRLSRSRMRMQMLEIEHNNLRATLNRRRERVMSDILGVWGYDRLVRNGRLLGEIASQKIDEINERKAAKRSLLTDMILGGIGFFAVIDLLLYLHEFSREVMSRPALEYNDSHLSAILTFIARIDTDTTILSGFVLIGVLIFLYYLLRRGK